jgi:uncharacterized SAM-binding protein YcdF (DUF218 family)
MASSADAHLTLDSAAVEPAASRPPRSVVRHVVQIGIVVLLVCVAYYAVSFWQVWSTGRTDQARAVDAIVVMGAAQYDGRPSPQLAARLDQAVELWDRGLAPLVVVTGGNREGDRFTEAWASAEYLLDRGVPTSAIVQEDVGSTTYESLERARSLVDGSVVTVLVVTDPYHSLRTRLTAEEVGFTAYASPARESVVEGVKELRRQAVEAAGVAVGRIIGFGRLSGLTG